MILLSKKNSWYLFDFGLSAYPTLILTFFYSAFFAKSIAQNVNVGASYWGISISLGSILSIILFFILFYRNEKEKKTLSTTFFFFFFILLITCSFCFFFFDKGDNQFFPLILVVFSFISFEVLNLFYNTTLIKVEKKERIGQTSNIAWSMGYLGGLISIFFFLYLLTSFPKGFGSKNIFLFVGPFVAIWVFIFCFPLFKNFKNEKFFLFKKKQIKKEIFLDLKIRNFILSYFFFNCGVVSLFYFSGIYASNNFLFSTNEILVLGISVNFFGVVGCLMFSFFDDNIGSSRSIHICITCLLILVSLLLITKVKFYFWVIALIIGFFIGPIQASSRSNLSKLISSKEDQITTFIFYSILGNLCSLIGPLLISIIILYSNSLKFSLALIPVYFAAGLILLTRDTNV